MSRSRNFCFTRNNYVDTSVEDTIDCKYIIYGQEVGESGTPHLQGFITFSNARSLKAVQRLLKGCHVEPARTVHQAIEYCKKDGKFTERGDPPLTQQQKGEKEKRRWQEILTAAQEGRDDDIPADIRFKYDNNIRRIRNDYLRNQTYSDTETKMLWYWGSSGTGKSRKARTDHPDAYLKMCNKWWDGYANHDTVIIEDFDKKHDVLVHHLKIWADRYPFPVEVKGGSYVIRPKLIIVTSNYHPTHIWDSEADRQPILRRFNCIEFKTLYTAPSGGGGRDARTEPCGEAATSEAKRSA